MAVFENCSILLELKGLSVKEKKKLRSAVTQNGGNISFVVNKKCSLVVTGDVSNLSSNRLRSIQRYQTPVVGVDYISSCVQRGVLLPVDEFQLDPAPQPPPTYQVTWSTAASDLSKVQAQPEDSVHLNEDTETSGRSGHFLEKFRIYTETDSNLPTYPDHFQVAKYAIFEKASSNTWCVLELQSVRGKEGPEYRVVRYWKEDVGAQDAAPLRDMLVFLSTSEDALEVYQTMRDTLEASGLQRRRSLPPQVQDLGSAPLQQLLLEEKLNTAKVSQEVGVFVELLWTEALGCLGNILRVSINKLSLSDVSRAEGLLLQAQKKLKEEDQTEAVSLLEEFYTLVPHTEPCMSPEAKLISQKLDLCQLIRDVLNVSEMTLWTATPSCMGKYRALRCSIESVSPSSSEFKAVTGLLQNSEVQIQQVLRVSRAVELQTFSSELGNIQTLLHSSSPHNFVGILSRGLLLPRVGVEHHGIDRTDVGNLGSGIYFSDAVRTSLKYSKPSVTDGSRLLLVCDVALGRCRDVQKKDVTLTQAPEGHHSVHGVRRTGSATSEFEDDEYVVYSPDQVKLKYVVQFSIKGDPLKDFSPVINMSAEPSPPASEQKLSSEEEGFENIQNPLDHVKGGLVDSSGLQLPLQAVHVKCRLRDLLCQVFIFHHYTNHSPVPIEAKYVFPLDDSAAVTGFEAFINGKHVKGQVKEKEKARKEYKQAIERGHGAYLMDQDAPDVFTISVGNLPPGATVLIKVTYVSELIVKDGSILFSIPGRVAPWQESAALNQTTQVTVEKVCVTDEATSSREFTLDMFIQMPYEICSLQCITHKIKIKKTECSAVVSVIRGQLIGPEGFQLSLTLSEIHQPRMWVETHGTRGTQACMLVFYPEFEAGSRSAADEVVLLLDTSESMKGEPLLMARRIALQVLKKLDNRLRLNVMLFGTDHSELFLTAQPLSECLQEAASFIKHSCPVGGSTELWRPLRALSLLPPSRGVRNLLLLTDGHIQNREFTLQLLRDNAQHSRLFTCGLSPTANRHTLRALALAGGGAYEFFDTKTKHNWTEKVARQVKRMVSPGCSSVSVKWQQFNPAAPPPVQAPQQLHALFSDSHTLVYGFVPHCTQAALLANLNGREFKTIVSTTKMQTSHGAFLHQLTARALIRDYEDGSLDSREAEHEGKRAELKSYITELSKEFSILSQFTSFVAIEERDPATEEQGSIDVSTLVLEEDVDFLPYMSWTFPEGEEEPSDEDEDREESSDEDFGGLLETAVDRDQDVTSESRVEARNLRKKKLKIFLDGLEDDLEEEEEEESLGFLQVEETVEERASLDRYFPSRQASRDPEPLQSRDEDHSLSPQYSPTSPPYSRKLSRHRRLQQTAALTDELEVSMLTCKAPRDSPECLSFPRPTKFSSLTQIPPVSSLAHFPPPPPPHQTPPPPPHHQTPPPPPPPPHQTPSHQTPPPPHQTPPPPPHHQTPPPPPPPSPHPHQIPPPSPPMCGLSMPPLVSRSKRAFSRASLSAGVTVQSSAPEIPSNLLFGSSTPFTGPTATSSAKRQFGFLSVNRLPAGLRGLTVRPGAAEALVQGAAMGFSFGSSQSTAFGHTGSKTTKNIPEGFQMPQELPQGQSFMQVHPQTLVIPSPGAKTRKPLFSIKEYLQRGSPFGARGRVAAAPVGKVLQRFAGESIPVNTWAAEPSGIRHLKSSIQRSLKKTAGPEVSKQEWTQIFQMQQSEGYWELTTELGELLNVNVDVFANVFLKNKGIHSLGVKACADILRMVATLLVLQLMRIEKREEGKLLRTLFCLEESCELRPEWWEEVKKAVDWVCWADRQYPCVYSRLEFGWSWESSTRQLLGYEDFPPCSPLKGLDLRRTRRYETLI